MDSLLNPKISGGNAIAISLMTLGVGAYFSLPRILTSAAQSGNANIAATRVDKCRIVGGGDKLTRGGYYYQPTANGAEWLSASTLLCDLYGNSGEIYEGGYLQHLTTTDPLKMNKVLMKRLQDKNNPDNNPALRPRRDPSVPIYQPPAPTQENTQFTGEPNG